MFTKMVNISEKGQVTIPKKMRDSLNLNDSDVIVLVQEGNKITIQKATDYLTGGKGNG